MDDNKVRRKLRDIANGNVTAALDILDYIDTFKSPGVVVNDPLPTAHVFCNVATRDMCVMMIGEPDGDAIRNHPESYPMVITFPLYGELPESMSAFYSNMDRAILVYDTDVYPDPANDPDMSSEEALRVIPLSIPLIKMITYVPMANVPTESDTDTNSIDVTTLAADYRCLAAEYRCLSSMVDIVTTDIAGISGTLPYLADSLTAIADDNTHDAIATVLTVQRHLQSASDTLSRASSTANRVMNKLPPVNQ